MTEGNLPPKLRRAALEALSRDRLADLTAKLELTVEDRRAQAAHIDAIVRTRSLDFGQVLRLLQRKELKAICEALGLDPSGKEKEAIVERILGAEERKEEALPVPTAADAAGKYAAARPSKK